MGNFNPPPISIKMLDLVEGIGELLGKLGGSHLGKMDLKLRRANRVKTIQASLEIEGNLLTVDQVTAVLDGKPVLGSPRDILEIRNAIMAYEFLDQWSPYSQKDLLAAHKILMTGILDHPGKYRGRTVGIQKGKKVVHLAPPAGGIPALMKELFGYVRKLEFHPLIQSSIFHYEFEFVHPFLDGNGRLGRLWQTLLLSHWKPIFKFLPVESVVRDNQQAYYAALNQSNQDVHPGIFVEFMLSVILVTLEQTDLLETPPVSPPVSPPVKKLLKILRKQGPLGAQAILKRLKLKDRRRMRESYINPAMKLGLIEYTIPDKPNSRNQQYRLTQKTPY